MGREEPGDSHPVISEGGRAWCLDQEKVVPEPEPGQPTCTYNIKSCIFLMSPEVFLILACLEGPLEGN
jgi:hypothetical protein